MANGNDGEAKFSFGTRELREARRTPPPAPNEPPPKPVVEGFDPYNTSGSFDRRKNWERVGKR